MESLISDICHIVAGKLKEEGNLLVGVPKEAAKMVKNLKHIKTVMASAEKKALMKEEDAEGWISELKEVAYDIEDVLEDWSDFQPQMQGGESSTSQRGNKPPKEENQVRFSCIPTPCFCIKQVKGRHQIAHDIAKINERLDDIADRRKKLDFEKNYVSSKDIVEPESISTPFDDIVLDVQSQEEAKSRLIQKLVHDFSSTDVSPNHIPIVSIVGMGGIGKTTLAQMVYTDQTVKNHFSSKMIFWVCVSDNSTQLKVAKAIAVALGLHVADLSDLTIVLTKIVDYIKDLTFLLVLDDVWENSVRTWDAILTCLGKADAKQSRILLTTRSSDLAERMEAAFTLDVAALSEDDSWSLFSHYAFKGRTRADRMEVENIARELVRKCKGLPLALQVLGKFMRTKKVTRLFWQDVLSNKIWETKFKEDVFPSLMLSYLDLPSQAKRCFTFCSIFPKDTVMRKNRLIRLWMAQGYLQENTTDNMEFNGEQYFECLVTRSFFRVREKSYSYEPGDVGDAGDADVTMHDLVHDFAQYISDGEATSVDPSIEVHVGAEPRHIAFSGEIGKSICSLCPNIDLKALRTLLITENSTKVLENLSLNKFYIRALETVDISVSLDLRKLVHLRYMLLRWRHETFLPEGICDLRHLQILDLKGCYRLESLPKDIERLTCLRHLFFNDYLPRFNLPKGLAKLSSLRTLSYFPCSSVHSIDCSSLEGLKDLNNLRGQLWLTNLHKVEQDREATGAQLHKKKNIQQLRLEFGEGNPIIQSDVLDALKPATENNIELLEIREHKGHRCPGWIGELRNLKKVVLWHVGMEVLPAGLGLLRHLEILRIEGANGVKSVGEEFLGTSHENIAFFPKLTKLIFEGMSQWEHWEGSKEISTVMPCLRKLMAISCEALQTLPGFLEHVPLESLIVDSHHLSQQLELVEDDDHQRKLRMGNAHLPQTLKYIRISTELMVAPSGILPETALEVGQQESLNLSSLEIDLRQRFPGWIIDLTCLKYVKLSHIEDECLPPLGLMCSLEELEIRDAEKVEKVGDEFLGIPNSNYSRFNAFPKLKKLTFWRMPAWGEWEGPAYRNNNNNLIIMPCLWRLEIQLCGTLKSLPQFFKVVPLKELYVGGGFMPMIGNTSREDEPTGQMVKASLAGLEVLQSLEKLDMSFGDVGRLGKEVLQISSLNRLYLAHMNCLEEWEDPPVIQLENESRESQHDISSYRSIESNLRILLIGFCPKLKALPSFLRSTTLETLLIQGCPALETWWANEAGGDWHRWASGIPKTTSTDVSLGV